ncbi:MAG: hypothetical protein ABMA64_06745 [Myxococcota bacterium]
MFAEVPSPWVAGASPLPAATVAEWVRTSHRDGSTRLSAVREALERLRPLGFTSCALVAGPWLSAAATVPGVGKLDLSGRRAEVAGDLDRDWLAATVDAFLADPARARPPESVRAYRVAGPAPAVLVDLAVGGRRPGLAVFVAAPGADLAVDGLLTEASTWWVFLGIAGLLRADGYWTHWNQVVELLLTRGFASDEAADRPVNAQEVTLRVGEFARRWAASAALAFEVATVGVFVPDPDDEYVWALGASGTERYAYDAGLVLHKPPVAGVGYGLTAAWACAPAVDPHGRPVVVRDLADRDALRERYRDLGFDDEALAAPTERGPFLGERFTEPGWVDATRRGPWVFTAQRLPRSLSPSGRNLVVRFCGRTTEPEWSTDAELVRSSHDRRSRVAAAALRIAADVVRGFEEGLATWRAGARDEVTSELAGARRLDAVCRLVAQWCSARAVTVWDLDERTLTLAAWSRPAAPPALALDTADRLDARELRLLQAPSWPRRHEIGSDGFLAWSPLEDALGGPAENVGTAPVVRGGRTVGLVRIDGAMSLFAGAVDRTSRQSALHRHRPTATPAHVRPVVEEVARLLAVSRPEPAPVAGGPWATFVDQVERGALAPAEARARLAALHARAPSRGEAAAAIGVHRNTFRRWATRLARALGPDAVPW